MIDLRFVDHHFQNHPGSLETQPLFASYCLMNVAAANESDQIIVQLRAEYLWVPDLRISNMNRPRQRDLQSLT